MQDINLFNFDEYIEQIKEKEKGRFLGDEVAQNNAPCQYNKKVLPLSLESEKGKIYGLSAFDLKCANEKLETQRDYLKGAFHTNAQTGEIKSYLDLSMSANFGKKYYAELVNRSNVINSFQFDFDLMPVFLTITLNGCFRKALKGDFSTFKPEDKKNLDYALKFKLEKNEAFTIKDLINLLNHQWNLFVMRLHRKYKNLNKLYIRCFEPHKKDGVPHIHALLYVPKFAFDFTFKVYKDIFKAPQNIKQGSKLSKEQVKNGEINGFQWSLSNPTGYVMKYIYKTFINLNKSDELDYLSAWYVKHKVRRFITSKTPVPLWIYRKVNVFKKDFYHLCNVVNNPDYLCEWSFDKKYFCFVSNDESFVYENGKLTYKFKDRVLFFYEKEQVPKPEKKYLKLVFKSDLPDYYTQRIQKSKIIKDYTLLSLLKDENFKYENCKKIAYHANMAIDRGLLDLPKFDLNKVCDSDLTELGLKYVF